MNFKNWLVESTVETKNIATAIEKSIEFIVPGRWKFRNKDHIWYRDTGKKDSVNIMATGNTSKGRFWVNIYTIADAPTPTYDSKTGNSSIEILVSIFHVFMKINPIDGKEFIDYHHLGEAKLKTPYEVANWIDAQIDNFGKDDEDGPEDITPTPNPSLVGAS